MLCNYSIITTFFTNDIHDYLAHIFCCLQHLSAVWKVVMKIKTCDANVSKRSTGRTCSTQKSQHVKTLSKTAVAAVLVTSKYSTATAITTTENEMNDIFRHKMKAHFFNCFSLYCSYFLYLCFSCVRNLSVYTVTATCKTLLPLFLCGFPVGDSFHVD